MVNVTDTLLHSGKVLPLPLHESACELAEEFSGHCVGKIKNPPPLVMFSEQSLIKIAMFVFNVNTKRKS